MVIDGETKLNNFMSTFDLTAMGVGATLGMGVYVLTGEVAKNVAGPAVIFSFIIAAFATMLAGFCFAELGARVPKAGSAYIYTFVTIGEFVAFIIGWNLIMEYAIGSAVVAKGITGYINDLADHKRSRFWKSILPLPGGHMGSYVDLFAFAIVMVVSSEFKIQLDEIFLLQVESFFIPLVGQAHASQPS
jgi:solute carrier family 7 (cationic amino acid transporter), member 2